MKYYKIDFLEIFNRLKFLSEEPLRIQYANFIIRHFKKLKKKNIKMPDVIRRLKNNEPIEYIFNVAEFCGLEFYVNKYTLIPREETEKIVYLAIDLIKLRDFKFKTIIDVGTGSGCIIISIANILKDYDDINYVAIDVSRQALDVARFNAKKFNLEDKIHFLHSDFRSFPFEEYDAILVCANLPYIPSDRILPKSVSEYEPHTAIWGTGIDGDGLIKDLIRIYRKVNNIKCLIIEKDGGLVETLCKYKNSKVKQSRQ